MSYFSFFFLSLEKMWHPFNFIVLSVPHLKQSSWSFQQQAILAPNPMMEYYMHGTLSGRIWFDSQFSQDVFHYFMSHQMIFLSFLTSWFQFHLVPMVQGTLTSHLQISSPNFQPQIPPFCTRGHQFLSM